jgi:hypothetical protein
MPIEAKDVTAILEKELQRLAIVDQQEKVRALLVTPRREDRGWDYGEIGQTYPCWIVAEHPASNTAIAYCEHGFGPRNPWGLLFISPTGPRSSMGMDSGWFSHFDECVMDSLAWESIDN